MTQFSPYSIRLSKVKYERLNLRLKDLNILLQTFLFTNVYIGDIENFCKLSYQ